MSGQIIKQKVIRPFITAQLVKFRNFLQMAKEFQAQYVDLTRSIV